MKHFQGLDMSNHRIDASRYCTVRFAVVSPTTPVSSGDPLLQHNAIKSRRGLHAANPMVWGGTYYSNDSKEAWLHPLLARFCRRYADSKPSQGTTR